MRKSRKRAGAQANTGGLKPPSTPRKQAFLRARARSNVAKETVARDNALTRKATFRKANWTRTNRRPWRRKARLRRRKRRWFKAARKPIPRRIRRPEPRKTPRQAAQAGVAAAQAQVEQDELNIQRAVITSPVDGTVIARDVSVGQTVAASLQTPTLFSIAQNLHKMEVDINVGEPDIGNVRPGDAVSFSVLAYPNQTFTGTVSQVRVNPTTVNNVVTYTVITLVNNPNNALLPGMTANATIEVKTAKNALVVPTQALSFRPTGTSQRTIARTRRRPLLPTRVRRGLRRCISVGTNRGRRIWKRNVGRHRHGVRPAKRQAGTGARTHRLGQRRASRSDAAAWKLESRRHRHPFERRGADGAHLDRIALGRSGRFERHGQSRAGVTLMQPVVRGENLRKIYDLGSQQVTGIAGVDLTIAPGEFLAVMGPSGSGKSTFMHIIGLLDEPTDGLYEFEGSDVSRLSEDERADIRSRRLGFVFQSYNLLPRTTAVENVELPMLYAGVPDSERRRIALEKMQLVGVAHLANHAPNQMSGGQQQRVAIARSLVNNPALILADEPTGALDTKTSQEVMQLFTRLNEEHGITILLVTHESDVAAYAKRVVTFRDGRIVSDSIRAPRARGGASMKTTMKVALDALLRNRVRSLLTMLGVIIGVAAVIVTVAIGNGARVSVQNQINSLGSNMVVVLPGSVTQGGARSGFGGASTLTPDDGMAIAKLPGVAAVSPSVTVRSQVVSGGNNWQTQITGVAPTYTFIRSWPMASGTFFSQNDVLCANKVAVLGQTVVQNLFPDGSSPLGKAVIIQGVPFTVVGTLSPLGQSGMGQDQDDTILIPYTAAMQRLTGQTTVNSLMVSASDAQHVQTGANGSHDAARTAASDYAAAAR